MNDWLILHKQTIADQWLSSSENRNTSLSFFLADRTAIMDKVCPSQPRWRLLLVPITRAGKEGIYEHSQALSSHPPPWVCAFVFGTAVFVVLLMRRKC